MSDEPAEDSGRAESAAPELEEAVPRRPSSLPHSSFSSSLGDNDPSPAGAGMPESAGPPVGVDWSASSLPPPATDSGSPQAQLAGRVSGVSSTLASLSSERPEVVVGAAFVGGLVIAMILKRLAR